MIIKNGLVFDPANKIDGEKKDIVIINEKIVDPSQIRSDIKFKTIDATNLVVMPGGVDIHAHIAGPKVNAGRLLRPEDHMIDTHKKTPYARAGVGRSVPSTFYTGYAYAKLGYTCAMEPAMPPLEARHTHEELMDIPIIDKGAFTLLGSNWFLLERISNMKINEMCAFVSWLLYASGGHTIKLVNPGGEETWAWGKNVCSLDDKITYFKATPRKIIKTLAEVNEKLALPQTIHLHTNNLGVPGNYEITKETMECLRGIKSKKGRETNVHITHIQFSSYGGKDWRDFRSEAPEIAHYINKHKHVSCDIGQIVFTNTTTMTADGAWEWALRGITENLAWSPRSGSKWMNAQVELESCAGVVPYIFRRRNSVNATQWAIGLEILLSINDLTKVNISTDHPNGGPFTFYPLIFSWLMSQKARENLLSRVDKAATEKSSLKDIIRELSLSDIAQVSRTSAANILGLEDKGHLGVGADADVAIYEFKTPLDNLNVDFKAIEKGFSNAKYTIKDGEIVYQGGKIVASPQGRTYRVKAEVPESWTNSIQDAIEERFRQFYTVNLNNYAIQQDYFPREELIVTKVT
ncbi:MAG: formylmethanofuran dehydrogenase subunit A [Candidatus Heimdallarchaeota archaeon]|nr:formylmethanofuran dehydrogenase subunit A [Candidatus Heimdallarchaeota archaeon]MBY8995345.1 formylmethanofuran dehydrogenase subunit A [Candidatus Heimdallarchaeota archaeon]